MNRKDTMDVVARVVKFYDGEPPIDVLANELQMTERDARLMYERYTEKQSKVKAKRAPRKKKEATVPAPVEVAPEPVDTPMQVAEEIPVPLVEDRPVIREEKTPELPKPTEVEHGLEKIHELPVDLIRTLSAAVAFIMLVRPIGYAIDYLSRFNDIWFAIFMALGMVTASFISPQILVLAIRQVKYFTAAMALLCTVIFSFLLINITVDELKYVRESVKTAQVTGKADDIKNEKKVRDLEQEIADATAEVTSKKEKMEMITKRLDGLDPSDVKYKSNYNDWLKTSGEVEAIQKGITKKRQEVRELRSAIGTVVTIETDVKTTDREQIVDWLLAISQDVAGPLFLSFALFLSKTGGRRRAKTSDDHELSVSPGDGT